jgi:hypothetical protein
MLNDGELRAWAKQVKRALFDASITKVEAAALIQPDIYTRKPRKDDPYRPPRPWRCCATAVTPTPTRPSGPTTAQR